MRMLIKNLSQHKAVELFAYITVLALLTGCANGTTAQDHIAERIYFSHSINNAPSPDSSKGPGVTSDKARSAGAIPVQEVVLYFDNDSAVVRGEDVERLQSFLLNFPPQTMPVFLITGHTDSNHSETYNIGLSDRRAKSTQIQMLRMGVPITQTALRALGESTPAESNSSATGRELNRRVTIKAID